MNWSERKKLKKANIPSYKDNPAHKIAKKMVVVCFVIGAVQTGMGLYRQIYAELNIDRSPVKELENNVLFPINEDIVTDEKGNIVLHPEENEELVKAYDVLKTTIKKDCTSKLGLNVANINRIYAISTTPLQDESFDIKESQMDIIFEADSVMYQISYDDTHSVIEVEGEYIVDKLSSLIAKIYASSPKNVSTMSNEQMAIMSTNENILYVSRPFTYTERSVKQSTACNIYYKTDDGIKTIQYRILNSDIDLSEKAYSELLTAYLKDKSNESMLIVKDLSLPLEYLALKERIFDRPVNTATYSQTAIINLPLASAPEFKSINDFINSL